MTAIAMNTHHHAPARRDCANCVGRSSCFVQELLADTSASGSELVVSHRTLHRGDPLFRQGESFGGLYLIRSGALKVTLSDSSGDYQVVSFLGQGDIAGLDASQSGRHACNAEALDTTSVCYFSFEALCDRLSESPHGLRAFLANLGACINEHTAMMMRLGQKSAEQRMASFLIERVEKLRGQGLQASEVDLPMSRADIGSYLALAVETVSRLLTRLQSAGVIKVHRHCIEISDEARLRELGDEPVEEVCCGQRRLH